MFFANLVPEDPARPAAIGAHSGERGAEATTDDDFSALSSLYRVRRRVSINHGQRVFGDSSQPQRTELQSDVDNGTDDCENEKSGEQRTEQACNSYHPHNDPKLLK